MRVDAGVAAGLTIGAAYDSLLAKVIARGRTPSEAASRLDRALAELKVVGVATTAPLVRAILDPSDGGDWRGHHDLHRPPC